MDRVSSQSGDRPRRRHRHPCRHGPRPALSERERPRTHRGRGGCFGDGGVLQGARCGHHEYRGAHRGFGRSGPGGGRIDPRRATEPSAGCGGDRCGRGCGAGRLRPAPRSGGGWDDRGGRGGPPPDAGSSRNVRSIGAWAPSSAGRRACVGRGRLLRVFPGGLRGDGRARSLPAGGRGPGEFGGRPRSAGGRPAPVVSAPRPDRRA